MRRFYWIAALTVIIDQVTKWLCTRLTGSVILIPRVLALTYAENTGMAFSMLSGHSWLLGVVSAVCILVGWLVMRRYTLGTASRIAAMLMLGGAVGNMIDRFLRGYVVDMFEALFVDFAIFNVADAALTVGTILLACTLLFRPTEWQEKPSPKEARKKG